MSLAQCFAYQIPAPTADPSARRILATGRKETQKSILLSPRPISLRRDGVKEARRERESGATAQGRELFMCGLRFFSTSFLSSLHPPPPPPLLCVCVFASPAAHAAELPPLLCLRLFISIDHSALVCSHLGSSRRCCCWCAVQSRASLWLGPREAGELLLCFACCLGRGLLAAHLYREWVWAR